MRQLVHQCISHECIHCLTILELLEKKGDLIVQKVKILSRCYAQTLNYNSW